MTSFPPIANACKIGLGCVTFGREIDETAAMALLDHAYARGVTDLDTAAAYGQGASERILGRWLASRRPVGMTVATKILPPYEPAGMAAAVEGSLRRLGVEAGDLLYLHRWDETAASPATLTALDALLREGKVRALGVSNCDERQLTTALALQQQHGLARFSVVQNNHNLAVSDVTEGLRAICHQAGVKLVTYSPLGAGFLTGKHRQGVEQGSRFEVIPGHQDVYFHEAAWARLARLEAVAARTGHPQAHLALAWALHQPGIDCVLVGGRSTAHLDQALAAQTFEDLEVLAALEME